VRQPPVSLISHALSLRASWISELGPDSDAVSLSSSPPGFGYNFDALESREDDLSSAFDAIMKTDNSPAQSTIIPLIGSIAPWVISVVSSSRFRNHRLMEGNPDLDPH